MMLPKPTHSPLKSLLIIIVVAGGSTVLILGSLLLMAILSPNDDLSFNDLFINIMLGYIFLLICPWLSGRFLKGHYFSPQGLFAHTVTHQLSYATLPLKTKWGFVCLHLASGTLLLALYRQTAPYWMSWGIQWLLLLSGILGMAATMAVAALYAYLGGKIVGRTRTPSVANDSMDAILTSWGLSTSLSMALAAMMAHMVARGL
ncbi:MAG: hypothetical protein KA214_09290 [Neisseriaceae bacterium]|nr:hypothetical protein [Neisseriaceae bacterium]